MKSEGGALLMAFGAGAVLGLGYLGGLWWTCRRGLASKRPWLWFTGSFLVRTALLLGGFYLVAGDRAAGYAAAALGFLVAKVTVRRAQRALGEGGAPDAP